MNPRRPKVSIISCTYNNSFFFDTTLSSIKKQTFTDFEFVVVDDHSEYKEFQHIEKILSESQIPYKIKRLDKNLGPGNARNVAIKMAEGDYIAFLDSDDIWEKEKLDHQIKFMEKLKIDFSCTAFKILKNGHLQSHVYYYGERFSFSDISKWNTIQTSSVIITKELSSKVEFPNIRKRQDYAYFLRLLRICNIVYCMKEPLLHYTKRSGSVSSNIFKNIPYQLRVYRQELNQGRIKATLSLLRWMVLSGQKTCIYKIQEHKKKITL